MKTAGHLIILISHKLDEIKALCDRATILRPGLIVGPLDKTDRYTYWPVRMARGGEVLAASFFYKSFTDAIEAIAEGRAGRPRPAPDAGEGVGSYGTAVGEVGEHGLALLDDLMALAASDVGDEADEGNAAKECNGGGPVTALVAPLDTQGLLRLPEYLNH